MNIYLNLYELMRKLIRFLLFAIFLFIISSDTSYSSTQNTDNCSMAYFFENRASISSDSSVDIKYYKLNLNISLSPDYLNGAVMISCRIRSATTQSVFIDLTNNMFVDSIVSSSVQLSFSHDNDKINIDLNRPYSLNETLIFTIYYKGLPKSSGYGSFVFGSHSDNPAVWTLSQPFGSRDWFPCKNDPDDKADSSMVTLTVPSFLRGVSNGILLDSGSYSAGTRSFTWKNSYPIASYLISLAVSNYSIYRSSFKYSAADSMEIVHWIYPEDLESLKPLLDKTPEMLKFFSDTYGLYPFIREKYGHVQFGRNAGMEHQTISSMGAWSETIVAHELTHQWFGDKITCRNWQNIWLNEGFATYGEALWQEHKGGKIAYNDFINFRISDSKRAAGSVYVQDPTSIGQIFDGTRSYAKGGVILHMLRGITGDSVFFNILRTYASDPAIIYSTAVTDDFKRNAEKIYGSSLAYFFNEWIYGEKYPKYNVNWDTELLNDGRYNVKLQLDQDANTNPAFFTMPVNFKINSGFSDTTVTFLNNSQMQSFEIAVAQKPLEVRFDPDNFILKDVRGNIFDVPVSFSLGQNYPNPFNPSTNLYFETGRPSFVKIRLFDISGRDLGTIYDSYVREGRTNVSFAGRDLASGIYYYQMISTSEGNILHSEVKKMIKVK
ncbi:M1 family aminopeptidase [soil metagenome]